MRAGIYQLEKSPFWKGGQAATDIRSNFVHRRPRVCADCNLPFIVLKGDKSKYCLDCRIVNCVCLYCQSHFTIKRRDFDDGRGEFCSLKCYRTNLALFPKMGVDTNMWRGGVTKIHGYGNKFKGAYKARRDNADGFFTKVEWSNLKKKYQYICLCCKQQEPDIKLEPDHIIPLSKGGKNVIENIQPLCRSCNARKYNKIINYIEQYA